jgi:hypothetical protein
MFIVQNCIYFKQCWGGHKMHLSRNCIFPIRNCATWLHPAHRELSTQPSSWKRDHSTTNWKVSKLSMYMKWHRYLGISLALVGTACWRSAETIFPDKFPEDCSSRKPTGLPAHNLNRGKKYSCQWRQGFMTSECKHHRLHCRVSLDDGCNF